MARSSFVLYSGDGEQIELLSNEEAGALFKALFRYVGKDVVMRDLPPAANMAFAFIRAQIDRDGDKYDAARQKRVEAGRLGGLQKALNAGTAKSCNSSIASNGKECLANLAVSVSDSVSVSVNNKLSDKSDCVSSFCRDVVDFLNQHTGKSYRSTTPATSKLVKARQSEGFTLEDFKTVISVKVSQWGGTDMEKYLRPATLFGTKFESYLQESERSNLQEPPRQADIDWDLVGYGPEEVSG